MATNDSELYEFDAPSHVVDLKELANTDTDDQWFEQQAVGAEALLVTPIGRTNKSTAVVCPTAETDVDAGPGTSTSPPPNTSTSFGPERRTGDQSRRTINKPPAEPRRVSKRKGVPSTSAQPTSAAPPSKKHKKSPVEDPAESLKSGNRSVPAAHTGQLSSEELELERIRNLQKEVALHRKKNEASYKAALAGNTRVKASMSSSASRMMLRRRSSQAKASRGATVPKPFNLSMGKKKMETSGAYVPMAQQIAQFQSRTPDRYHLRSRRSQERGPAAVKGEHLKLTMPHSPNLMTRQRSRPPAVKSSTELEAEMVENLHKFQFKAQELNEKILEHPEDLKRPAVKEPTVPAGFELQVEKRLQERQAAKKLQENEEKPHTFKAQPLPKKILEAVVGLPEKKVLQITVPESPAFALKNRVRVERKVEEEKRPSPVKAPPVPHFGLPFQPRLPETHNVEVCPFSFEERERERRARKEKRLEKQNEEVPQFKAQPLPDFATVVLPEKKKQEPTKPEPFRLLLDERGAVKNSRWEQKVKEEQKQREEATTFKANPNTVTHKEPFQPKLEGRTTTAVEPFELSTERRAKEWQEFEQMASEKEALLALMEEQQRQEEEQREREEIARLRQEQVHKAQPIRHYKPVRVKRSDVPLTVPHSPNFSDRFRL